MKTEEKENNIKEMVYNAFKWFEGNIPKDHDLYPYRDNIIESLGTIYDEDLINQLSELLHSYNGSGTNDTERFISSFMTNKEIKQRTGIEDNLLVLDNGDHRSFKKIIESTDIDEYEVMTDNGWVDIEALHKTVPYEVYELKLASGRSLKCADIHIIFNNKMEEVFVKDLEIGDRVITKEGPDIVTAVNNLGYKEPMYDLQLSEDSDKRYYTNGILSHNTHLAQTLAELVMGNRDNMIRIDMSEYGEKFSTSRLVGAPPGYVGYQKGGELTEKVKRNPYSVVLFDEVEKAHPEIFDVLLQVLDEGHLTDSLGRKINFKNTIIILTSNVGAQEMNNFGGGVGYSTTAKVANIEERKKRIVKNTLKKKFKPEFLNRVDDTIIFNTLSQENIEEIVHNEIDELRGRLKDQGGYKLNISKQSIKFLAKQGYDDKFGARELKRAIETYVVDKITDKLLEGSIEEGDTIKIDYSKQKDDLTIKINAKKTSSKKNTANDQ